MEQRHVQDWAARWQAAIHICTNGVRCPYDGDNLAHNPPRGGSVVGLGGHLAEDTRDCDSKQQFQSSLEVQPLWAQMECMCELQNKRNWNAPCVPVRPAASLRQGSPASAMERHTCWLSGTGKPMRDVAGTQTSSIWARTRRRSG